MKKITGIVPKPSIKIAVFRALTAIMLSYSAFSDADDSSPVGIYQALTGHDPQQSGLLREWGLTVGGWANAGFTYNPANPANGSNAPVSFNFRANEWHLHQLDLFLEKPIAEDTHGWAFGGRFDFMFGTDTPYTQAGGHWDTRLIGDDTFRFYKIALPQAYVDIRAPLGLSARIGHFYSIIGYESVAAPPNFFYSHSYSMKSSPFTHTGVLLSYPFTPDFTLYSGAVTGPDNFDAQFGAWSYLGGFNWNFNKRGASFSFSILNGDVSEIKEDTLTYYSAVLQYPITEHWNYVLQHDQGFQVQLASDGRMAAWHSIIHYLTWQMTEAIGVGARADWFRDQQGVRYGVPSTGYYAATIGLNWKPRTWLIIRPELRYDWSEGSAKIYDKGRENQQWLLGTDFVVKF